MRVLVDLLDARLVNVRMGVRVAVVRVLVRVLDMLMSVRRVRVDVRLAVMLMLVGMRDFVGVLVGHFAPVIVRFSDMATAIGVSGTPARR